MPPPRARASVTSPQARSLPPPHTSHRGLPPPSPSNRSPAKAHVMRRSATGPLRPEAVSVASSGDSTEVYAFPASRSPSPFDDGGSVTPSPITPGMRHGGAYRLYSRPGARSHSRPRDLSRGHAGSRSSVTRPLTATSRSRSHGRSLAQRPRRTTHAHTRHELEHGHFARRQGEGTFAVRPENRGGARKIWRNPKANSAGNIKVLSPPAPLLSFFPPHLLSLHFSSVHHFLSSGLL